MIEANELRNRLFEKYFETKQGILITDLVNVIKPITEIWKELRQILEENISDYSQYDDLEMIKMIKYNDVPYLIVKIKLWEYLIIDLTNSKVLSNHNIVSIFSEEFFIENFKEHLVEDERNFTDIYWFSEYEGNIQDLIKFYIANETVLNIPNYIYYNIKIDEAFTYLCIDIVSGDVQLGFQTPDQFLYEQLFLNPDLTPWGLQHSQSRIGVEKTKEMFTRIRDIKIPIESIPETLYLFKQEEFDSLANKENTLTKKLMH